MFYGTIARNLSLIRDISYTSPNPTEYTVEGLQAGVAYYFTVYIYGIYGSESSPSNIVSKRI